MKRRPLNVRVLVPILLVVGVAAGCGGGGGAAKPAADEVATVGSIHLAKTRFDDELSRARASLKAQGQTFPKQGTTEYESIKAEAMWLLVLGAARELEAKELGIEVTDAEVNTELTRIKKEFFEGSEAKYRAELKKEGLTDAEARNLIKGSLLSGKITTQITDGITVSDADVHKYFVENRAQYPDAREVQYILVGKKKAQLAEQIYTQLKGGADFAALAKKYSQDPSSKDTGGKLTAKKGELVPAFEKVAFSIKDGELAKPFETPEYGWFVVKAAGPVKSTEKDVAATIRLQLLEQKKNDTMTDWASDLAKGICTGDKIAYQIGYTPVPDPCAQYKAPTSTTATP